MERKCAACEFGRKIASYSDTHAILSALLTEARKVASADAGTAYLADGGELSFSAAQNGTLFPASAAAKYAYLNAKLPIDSSSMAGYAALTGNVLNVADARALPKDAPYGFNAKLDDENGYRTGAVLAAPLKGGDGSILGVLQIINPASGAFSGEMIRAVSELCSAAAIPLEKSFLFADMIIRMQRTAALRDPAETAGHVRRVGAIAAELWHRWAERRGIDPEELLDMKGKLRLAAMLHDIGKVGIPDAILKKPGGLSDGERLEMQRHSSLGAGLFDGGKGMDGMARDIALHHHVWWDGRGYTGDASVPAPSGSAIPLWARIVSIADVFDALASKRCYKDAWDMGKAMREIRNGAGAQFDPELADIFLGMDELVRTIMEKYGS